MGVSKSSLLDEPKHFIGVSREFLQEKVGYFIEICIASSAPILLAYENRIYEYSTK